MRAGTVSFVVVGALSLNVAYAQAPDTPVTPAVVPLAAAAPI